MKLFKSRLCTPAYLYFGISMFALILLLFQNMSNHGSYSVGNFHCKVPHTGLIFVAKFIYILFWTYVINLICKDGHSTLSWLLVLFPFLLFFVLIGMLMINR